MLVKTTEDVPLKHTIIEYDYFIKQLSYRSKTTGYSSKGTGFINTFVIDLLMPYFLATLNEFRTVFKDELGKLNQDPQVIHFYNDPYVSYKGHKIYTDFIVTNSPTGTNVDSYFGDALEKNNAFLDSYIQKIDILESDYNFLSLWARSVFNAKAIQSSNRRSTNYQYSLCKYAIPMFLKTNPWLEEFLEDNKNLTIPEYLKETYMKVENILLKYVSYNLICNT